MGCPFLAINEMGQSMPKPKKTIKHAEVVERFAERLRELRSSRGMTQAQLAREANVSVAYVGRLESSGAAPGIDLVDRIALALGVTLAELLPTGPQPDTLAVLKGRGKELFDTLMQAADRETLLMLNPLLAKLIESARGG